MGTPINTPFTGEIWHLTIDDLLEPLPASPGLGGPGPFVINLSASTAPISLPTQPIAECPGAHVYQIQRTEDRRVRYRLRLGPFDTEAEAESLLTVVREIYPSALAATAEPEDLRAIESIRAKVEAQQLAAVKVAMSKAVGAPLPGARAGAASPPERAVVRERTEQLATRPPPAWLALRSSATVAAEAEREPALPRPPADPLIPVLCDSIEVPQPAPARPVPQPPAAYTPAAPLRPVAAAQVPPLRTSTPAARTPQAPRPAAPAIHSSAPAPAESKPSAVPPPRRVEALSTPLSSLDTTQTLRPLTTGELEDAQALRWFAIQLSLADQSFDPDSLPNLDIFSEYRLYSVSVTDQGKPMHALRLGFFSEESAASAVAGYLGAFYEHPLVKRVSVAERERFSAQRVEARKDIGATGRHAVIEITDERVIRPKRPEAAALAPRSSGPSSSAAPMGKGK